VNLREPSREGPSRQNARRTTAPGSRKGDVPTSGSCWGKFVVVTCPAPRDAHHRAAAICFQADLQFLPVSESQYRKSTLWQPEQTCHAPVVNPKLPPQWVPQHTGRARFEAPLRHILNVVDVDIATVLSHFAGPVSLPGGTYLLPSGSMKSRKQTRMPETERLCIWYERFMGPVPRLNVAASYGRVSIAFTLSLRTQSREHAQRQHAALRR
jgi:hypothetical protein